MRRRPRRLGHIESNGRFGPGCPYLEDQHLIENLQRIYGYYIDKGMWTQAADLFADDAELEVAGRGAYLGKAHVLAYLRAIGPEGPQEGRLFDNMQLQPVVHVDNRGKTATARWHLSRNSPSRRNLPSGARVFMKTST